MSGPHDAALYELLTSCELLADTMDKTLTITRELAGDYTAGRPPTPEQAQQALSQVDVCKAVLVRFVALVQSYKTMFRTH